MITSFTPEHSIKLTPGINFSSIEKDLIDEYNRVLGTKELLCHHAEGLPQFGSQNAYVKEEESFTKTVRKVHVRNMPQGSNVISSHVLYNVNILDERSKSSKPVSQLVEAKIVIVRIESTIPILHPDGRVNEMLVKDVFQVQEELVDMLTIVEKETMRSGTFQSVVRFFKSGELKKAEDMLHKMKKCVLAVVQSGEIAKHSVALTDIRKLIAQIRSKNTRQLRLRPKLTPYFIGREKELCVVKDILDEYGSAAIMQIGGVGKTQFMVAFAERSEKRGCVPGGCYWIRGHGNRARFVGSLANFTETLTGDALSENDRRDLGVVLGALKKKLNSFTERWMLCIDNADSNEVNEVVGELCGLTEGCSSNGWVVVTSRQGGRTLWNGMLSGKKLKLNPLNVCEAMAMLLRRKEELLGSL